MDNEKLEEHIDELEEACMEAKDRIALLQSGELRKEDIPNWRTRLHGK